MPQMYDDGLGQDSPVPPTPTPGPAVPAPPAAEPLVPGPVVPVPPVQQSVPVSPEQSGPGSPSVPTAQPVWDRRTFLTRPRPAVRTDAVPGPVAYPAPTQLPQVEPPSPPVTPPVVILPQAGSPSLTTGNDTIATWPALTPESEMAYPVSRRTGEPVRPRTLLAAIGCCWLSVACTIVAFAWWWWNATHIPTFISSARLLTWTHPDPVSALAIVMVVLIGLIGVIMATAAGTVAYNSWAGKPWIRIGALVCLALTGLSFLLNWWFSIAMIPLAIAAGLLWLPSVRRFFTAMDDLTVVHPVTVPTTGILYGPQTLVGHR